MSRTSLDTPGVAAPQAHYSHAIRAGTTVYIAGQVPIAPDGTLVEGDIEAQVRQVMENLSAVAAAAGGSLDDIVKTTVYLTSRDDRAVVGRVRQEYFSDPPPANTLLVVAGLADPAMRVEIEAVLVLPS